MVTDAVERTVVAEPVPGEVLQVCHLSLPDKHRVGDIDQFSVGNATRLELEDWLALQHTFH